MNDELDALLRDHYRAAADGVHADPDTIRRFQDAGRAARPVRPARSVLRRWALPALAAAVTAAVLVAMAVFAWPGAREPEAPRPVAPPSAPPSTVPPPARTPSPSPGKASTGVPAPTTPAGGAPAPSATGAPVPAVPSATSGGSP